MLSAGGLAVVALDLILVRQLEALGHHVTLELREVAA